MARDGAALTYRFGRRGRPELEISGTAAGGNVYYHRTLYPHGEDQTLRFPQRRTFLRRLQRLAVAKL